MLSSMKEQENDSESTSSYIKIDLRATGDFSSLPNSDIITKSRSTCSSLNSFLSILPENSKSLETKSINVAPPISGIESYIQTNSSNPSTVIEEPKTDNKVAKKNPERSFLFRSISAREKPSLSAPKKLRRVFTQKLRLKNHSQQVSRLNTLGSCGDRPLKQFPLIDSNQFHQLRRVLDSATHPHDDEHDRISYILPNLPDLSEPIILSKSQLDILAPNLYQQHTNVQEMLGIRPLHENRDYYAIHLDQCLPLLSLLSSNNNTTNEERRIIFFKFLDQEGKGFITSEVIQHQLQSAIQLNSLYLSIERLHLLTCHVMNLLDVDEDGRVSYKDFQLVTRRWNMTKIGLPLFPSVINQNVDIFENDHLGLSLLPSPTYSFRPRRRSRVDSSIRWLFRKQSEVNFLRSQTMRADTVIRSLGIFQKIMKWFQLNLRSFLLFLLFSTVLIGFFCLNFFKFTQSPLFSVFGYSLSISKGSANVIHISLALCLTLSCRTFWTELHRFSCFQWLPLDALLSWHKICALLMITASWVHTYCHLAHNFPLLVKSNEARLILGLHDISKTWLYGYSIPSLTGWALHLTFFFMAVTSLKIVKHRYFEVFWYTHQAYILFIILILLHGSEAIFSTPTSWLYLLIPCILNVSERIRRIYQSSFPVSVLSSIIESDTLVLILTRPPFISQYRSGQYLLLNVPALSSFQWHPFSLTSCSEEKNLTIRIKRVGDWTGQLFELAQHNLYPKILSEVRINGIFGASAEKYLNYDHLFLIATGVGCTPFLSILHQLQQPHVFKRVDFFWLNKGQEGFRWMSETLLALDKKVLSVLRVHTFLTCAKSGEDIHTFLLWWGLETLRKRQGYCLLTNMQYSSVYWGKPHWESIFKQASKMYPNQKIGVLFCGSKTLGDHLSKLLRKINLSTPTLFEFAMENF